MKYNIYLLNNPELEQHMGTHLTVVDHVTKEGCPHPLHGAETEDVGGQSVEREVRGQPAERGGVGSVGVVHRS